MIGTLMGICILGMFLIGVLFPLGILIYMTVIFIKEKDWVSEVKPWILAYAELMSYVFKLRIVDFENGIGES